jgi:DNA-binding response OmpR family regulator
MSRAWASWQTTSFWPPAERVSVTRVKTILVASDAPSVRAEVTAVVGEPDVAVIEIHTGPAVPPAVHDHEPDLLVVDLQMGNMGAMAVCLELRLEESYGNLPHVPVLMLLDRRADVFLARRSGAEGWVVKPLDPMRIRRATRALLDGGTYHDESFQPVPLRVAGPDESVALSTTTHGA